MKKKELIFIIGIVIFALILWGGMYFVRRGHYGSVRITVNGEVYGTYSLAKDQVIQINDTNVCEIKNGGIQSRRFHTCLNDFRHDMVVEIFM